jgi:hypothetical protein
VYRKLLGIERDDKFRQTVQQFMQKTIGKPYRLNASCLLGYEDEKKAGGYFCSELIAKLLQTLNLLPEEARATSFWPGDFSLEKPENAI